MDDIKAFADKIVTAIDGDTFNKVTLSKPTDKEGELENVYIRLVLLKSIPQLSFTYRFKTNDQVKNYTIEKGIQKIQALLEVDFKFGNLFTKEAQITLAQNKKGNRKILVQQAPSVLNRNQKHDRKKLKRSQADTPFLYELGVCDAQGKVIPKMADKYRQINKYLEIIEGQLPHLDPNKKINIVDMGSGKGYLTFALYDYLKSKEIDAVVYGIELRQELVDFCNGVADKCDFEDLHFICQPIENFEQPIDVLIALHACDTATDDALNIGIRSEASLIICAPCCHKQIRQQLKGKEQSSPLLKYGIFKERQFEMVTDTIRALLLEHNQYKTNVFEFVSNEHTRKNIMMIAAKSSQTHPKALKKINALKEQYNIDYQQLEKLLSNNTN